MRKIERDDGSFDITDEDGDRLGMSMTEDAACSWLDGWAFAQGGDGWIRQTINDERYAK